MSAKSESLSIVCVQLSCPLYGVERWPRGTGFLSTILNGDAVGTKVSVHHRQGGRSSEVVVKRGSTVVTVQYLLCTYHVSSM